MNIINWINTAVLTLGYLTVAFAVVWLLDRAVGRLVLTGQAYHALAGYCIHRLRQRAGSVRATALSAYLDGDRVVVQVGIDTLAQAAGQNDCLHYVDPRRDPDGFFRVLDPVKFGHAVVRQLNEGDHMSAMMDDAVECVIEMGESDKAGWDWPAARPSRCTRTFESDDMGETIGEHVCGVTGSCNGWPRQA